ncbi:MAG: hypothetical protein HOP12_01100 [Candidatus Eisenbacteria bacterium]|uniref:FlgD Ig-like domain-containing protein n=1 Tax=Eiseniibacteriota bacterium TaxID=2212470 RepID=A0A849SJM0_UNCEI|nr:hypothetical protein [Candidatus Eisenbacteria bacterium]
MNSPFIGSASKRAGSILAIVALFLATIAATPAHAFQVFRHSNMTGEVLARQGVTGNTLALIKQGVRRPDINQCVSGCYCPEIVFYCDPTPSTVIYFSQFHYDNNQLLEGMSHVEIFMQIARDGLSIATPPTTDAGRRELGLAFIYFGVALHAIQDFYSHSTWVELNHDLIRIGGHIDSAPLWNGEDNWGTGSADVGGVEVAGVQTGFERLPTPSGSVTHAALNKDHANTAQSQKVVNRIFPFGLIGTYYEIASGQNGASGGSYKDTGLAPRHTIKAWQCLQSGCTVYQLPPLAQGMVAAGPPPARPAGTMDFNSLVAWINSDPGMTAAVAVMDSVWAAADQDSPQAFPAELFDAEGWPLPASTSVNELLPPIARTLSKAWPNPFRGSVSIQFYLPRAEQVRLEIFDAAGRRVATLVDRAMEQGWKDVVWDGATGSGRAAAPGSYLCKLSAFGRVETCRVVLVR